MNNKIWFFFLINLSIFYQNIMIYLLYNFKKIQPKIFYKQYPYNDSIFNIQTQFFVIDYFLDKV